jgi:hypothetical protein
MGYKLPLLGSFSRTSHLRRKDRQRYQLNLTVFLVSAGVHFKKDGQFICC